MRCAVKVFVLAFRGAAECRSELGMVVRSETRVVMCRAYRINTVDLCCSTSQYSAVLPFTTSALFFVLWEATRGEVKGYKPARMGENGLPLSSTILSSLLVLLDLRSSSLPHLPFGDLALVLPTFASVLIHDLARLDDPTQRPSLLPHRREPTCSC